MRHSLLTSTSAIVMGLSAMSVSTAAVGQEAEEVRSPSGLEEIVVTTQRREQNLQDVGIAVTALSGSELETSPINTAADVSSQMPNYQIVRSYAAPGFNTQITIRGVGQPNFEDTTEATATAYVDEFYMIGAGQSDFLMFDLERVEVARGPQGTVQGRNSTAGTINFYTRKPDFDGVSARAEVSLGARSLVRTNGYLNIPISDKVAFRGAFATDRNDGYLVNINPDAVWDKGGQNKYWAGRGQLLVKPNDDLTMIFKVEIGEMGPVVAGNEIMYPVVASDGFGTIAAEADAYGNTPENTGAGEVDVVNADGPNLIGHRIEHYYTNISWDASEDLNIVALGGFLKSEKFDIEDCDHTPDPLCAFSNNGESEHWTAEVRANYTQTNWRLTAGANYLDQELSTRSATPLFFNADVTPFPDQLLLQTYFDQQDLQSWAIFAQGEVDITDQLTLIAGARYTKDDKVVNADNATAFFDAATTRVPQSLAEYNALSEAAFANPASVTQLNRAANGDLAVFNEGMVNANVQLNFRPNDDILTYIAYRRGVKSGGFITGNVAGIAPDLRQYQEETNNAFEIGFKSTIMGGRARLNGAVFYYDYQDMQNTSFVNITNLVTNNDAEVFGGELELAASPIDGLNISGGIGILDTKVKDISNPTGAVPFVGDLDLPLAPDFTGNYKIRYTFPAMDGDMYVQTSGYGRTSMFRDSLNNPSTNIPGMFEANARIGYEPEGGQWAISGWVKNIFDSRRPINLFDLAGVGGSGEKVLQQPRWFGMTLSVKFGG